MTSDPHAPIPLGPPVEDGLAAAKRALRREMKRKLAGMSPEARAAAGERVRALVAGLPEFAGARAIMFYHALSDEPDLLDLMFEAIGSGREALLPVCDERSVTMRAVSVEDPVRDLREGAYGILEPREGLPLADPSRIGLVFVPGRAFDADGGRLGRGKGYYDRFLSGIRPAQAGGAFRLGVAFACQFVGSVPRGPKDARLDAVATENGVLRRPKA